MTSLAIYVTFNGDCEEAFNFYKSVLGGDFNSKQRLKDQFSIGWVVSFDNLK